MAFNALGVVLKVGGGLWGFFWGCGRLLDLWMCRIGGSSIEVMWGLCTLGSTGRPPLQPQAMGGLTVEYCCLWDAWGYDRMTDGQKGIRGGDPSSAITIVETEGGNGAVDELGVKSSRRLACRDATPVVAKVIARKARLLDIGGNGRERRTRFSRKKIMSKGLKCGVRLNEGEADSFKEFVSHKV